MTICVFAASSSLVDKDYLDASAHLGVLLARADVDVVFGGGDKGLMGKLADSVLENGGRITGVIPLFMKEEGWGHSGVNKMIITSDMGERKKRMFELSDAIIALPGGIGTLEELTEALTLKQLGLFVGPIIILNTNNFYRSLLEFFGHMVSGRFLRYEHKCMWEIAHTPEDIMLLLAKRQDWHHDPRSIARI